VRVRADAVVIRGPTGIGKTSTAWILHTLLRDARVPHAALDIDWLTGSWPEHGEWNMETRHRHVAMIAESYRQHLDVRYFVVSGIVRSAEEVERLRVCLGARELAVCRLHAPLSVVEARLRRRQPPEAIDWFLGQAATLDAQLPADGLDDFVVDADQPIGRVAEEIADLLGWATG
jgi:adenylylsulfate kinase-like enzyme